MSEEEPYITIRIPSAFGELMDKYIEENKAKMVLQGFRPSRAQVIKMALYEFLQINKEVEKKEVKKKEVKVAYR